MFVAFDSIYSVYVVIDCSWTTHVVSLSLKKMVNMNTRSVKLMEIFAIPSSNV